MKRLLMGLAAVAAMSLTPQVASAQAAADLTLVHGLPGLTVDVAVDGTVIIDAFSPGQLANISSFAGQTLTNVTVTDDATGDVIIGPTATLEVPTTGSHSVIAHLDGEGTPILSTFANNTNELASGQARFTLRHTAQAGAIDLVIGDQRPIIGLTNGQSGELELPDGELNNVEIAATGGLAVATLPPLDLAANTNTVVYGIGSVEGDTIDFVVQVVEFAVELPPSTTTGSVPTAVNTGSPLEDGSSFLLIAVALGGLTLAGGAIVARRRV